MLKVRLIPVLLLKQNMLVRSELFQSHQVIGNPFHEVRRFNEWEVDELIYLDITRGEYSSNIRRDVKIRGATDNLEILDEVSKTCFMPLTWGGRIKCVEDMRVRLSRGADKIVINSQAVREPQLIKNGAEAFGRQAIVVSIDVQRLPTTNEQKVVIDGGKTMTDMNPVDWAKRAEELGAGELLIQSTDRDGTAAGYDISLINAIATNTTIPVIACSGVGKYAHYTEGVTAGAAAVAAANIWHFRDLADRGGKRALTEAGIDVRT